MNKEDREKMYCVTSICKQDMIDDVKGCYDEKTARKLIKIISKLDDDDMNNIATSMADAYCSDSYWSDLNSIMEQHYFDKVLK